MSRCPSLATEGAVTRFCCHQQTVCLHMTSSLTVRPPQHCLFHSAILCDKDDKQSMPGALWRKADSGGSLKAGEKKHHTSDKSQPPAAAQNLPKSETGWNRYLLALRKVFIYLFIFKNLFKRSPNQINLHIWLVFISLVISWLCFPALQTLILSTSLNPGVKNKNIYSSNWMKNCFYVIPQSTLRFTKRRNTFMSSKSRGPFVF